jgi:hypothetical protein
MTIDIGNISVPNSRWCPPNGEYTVALNVKILKEKYFWGDSAWAKWTPGKVKVGYLDELGLGRAILSQIYYEMNDGEKAKPVSGYNFYVFRITFEDVPKVDAYYSKIDGIHVPCGDVAILGHEGWHRIVGQFHPERDYKPEPAGIR